MLFFRHACKTAKSRLSAKSCLSVLLQQLGSNWTDFHEILPLSIFHISVEKVQVSHQNLTTITGTLSEHQCTFTVLSRWIFLKMTILV